MAKLKGLIHGRIYFYKALFFESLVQVISPSFQFSLGTDEDVLILELAADSNLTTAHFKVHPKQYKNFCKEVKLEELPLYIYLPEKSSMFMYLLRGCHNV